MSCGQWPKYSKLSYSCIICLLVVLFLFQLFFKSSTNAQVFGRSLSHWRCLLMMDRSPRVGLANKLSAPNLTCVSGRSPCPRF